MSWKKWFDPGFYELQRLKKEVVYGPYVEVNPMGYSIRVLHRGEDLLYVEGARALLIAVDFSSGKISAGSISSWDDGTMLSSAEKKVVLERVVSYMLNFQKVVVVIV